MFEENKESPPEVPLSEMKGTIASFSISVLMCVAGVALLYFTNVNQYYVIVGVSFASWLIVPLFGGYCMSCMARDGDVNICFTCGKSNEFENLLEIRINGFQSGELEEMVNNPLDPSVPNP